MYSYMHTHIHTYAPLDRILDILRTRLILSTVCSWNKDTHPRKYSNSSSIPLAYFLRCLHWSTHILNIIISHFENKYIKAGNRDHLLPFQKVDSIVILPSLNQASKWVPICCAVTTWLIPGLWPASLLTYFPSLVSFSSINK